jgi:hypothetical protein
MATGCQPWAAIVRVKALAQPFRVPVEAVLVEYLIEPRVERMRIAAWQALRCDPHRRLLRVPFSFAHRHRDSVVRRIDRVDP